MKFKIGEKVAFKHGNCSYIGNIIGANKKLFTTLYMIKKDGCSSVECVEEKDVFKIEY